MTMHTSRRRFLAGALGGGVGAAFLAMFGSDPSYAANPSAPGMLSARVKQSLGGSAETLGGALPLGSRLADLRKGWDGTVWGVDEAGVPHTFDSVAGQWKIFCNGFDVVGRWDLKNGSYFVTRGAQISIGGRAPQALTDVWGNLPDTFAQGIDGAANVKGTIYLFRHGRYLSIDANAEAGPAASLRDTIANWPGKGTGNAWDQGAVDVVGSYNGSDFTNEKRVLLWAGGEFVFVDMDAKKVVDGPHPLSYYVTGQMLEGMRHGFSTMLWDEDKYDIYAFNGPVVWQSSDRKGAASASYASNYQVSWVPLLTAAPAGVAGDLWAAEKSGSVVHHDGTDWQPGPAVVGGAAHQLAVGVDGTVMALTGSLERLSVQTGGSRFVKASDLTFTADRITVADANHVFLRASDDTVRRWTPAGFTTLSLGHRALDIAAGSDGTLWHTAGDGRLYRYLSEGAGGSTSLDPGLPAGSVISRVAATGFGSAYLLTQDAQAHQFLTPFVFKTSKAYFQQFSYASAVSGMTTSGHTLYLSVTRPNVNNPDPDLVAVDTQTGLPRWTYRIPMFGQPSNQMHVLDPGANVIYTVADWKLYGVDADTGAQLSFLNLQSITTSTLGQPTVLDGTLYVGTSDGHLIAVDVSTPSKPSVRWSVELADRHTGYTPGAPTADNTGQVYLVLNGNGAGTRTVYAVHSSDGTVAWRKDQPGVWNGNPDLPYDVRIGVHTVGTAAVPALYVNNATSVACLDPATGAALGSFAVPQPSSGTGIGISSGMVLQGNTLYFGDTSGRVFFVDTLTLAAHRMVETGKSAWGIIGRPALIAGANPAAGDAVVCVTRGTRQVYFIDPSNGAVDTLVTDQTAPAALSYDDAHGVLYAAAWHDTDDDTDQIGQLFAIRPDSYVQDERSFIVESELMQDFGNETEAAAAASGGGTSRYQTHVSIVDGAKAPRPGMSVKLWADEDATAVSVDGQAFTIGPDTPAYFSADGSGSFTITSDATDLATTTLRMWAAFMDEHERVAVIPDAAFHQRLAQTTASGSGDPDGIDLVNAKDYQGKALFAAGEATQAGQAATAVTQLTGATGIGAPAKLSSKANGDSGARYLTYPDTPGLNYNPIAATVDRSVDSQQAAGIHLAAGSATVVSPAQAASLLDAMSGHSLQTLPGSFLSSLRQAWHEIKTAAAKVEQVIISVAKDVLAGIQYVVNGVTKVVKVVVKDIKDAAAAVGAFFVQLGKDIVKVIQALGKLLALGEVVKTFDMLKGWLTSTMTNDAPKVLAAARPMLTDWFSTAEQEVTGVFCDLSTKIGLGGCNATDNTPMKDWQSLGSTSSSIYGSAGTSSVQAGWSTQTLRTQSSSDQAAVALRAGADPTAALDGIFETFLADVAGDPVLSAQIANVKSAFGKALKATSADQFFASALQGVVDLMSTVAVLSLSVAHALIDTFLASAQTMLDAILNSGAANIPVLSALYHAMTGKDLSFIDLICFVLAFPVTYIFRALQGVFPSQAGALLSASGTPKLSTQDKVIGLFTVTATIVAGVVSSVISGLQAFGKTPPKALLYGGGVLVLVGGASSVFNAVKGQAANGTFDLNLTVLGGLAVTGAALVLARPKTSIGKEIQAVSGMSVSVINGIFSLKKYEDSLTTAKAEPISTLVREFFMAIPGVISPAKLMGDPLNLIPPPCDLLFRWGAAAIQLTLLIEDWQATIDETPTTAPTSTAPVSTAPRSSTPHSSTPHSSTVHSSAPRPTAGSTSTASTSTHHSSPAPATSTSTSTSLSTSSTAWVQPTGTTSPHTAELANTGVNMGPLVGAGIGTVAVGGFIAFTARRNRLAVERAGAATPVAEELVSDPANPPEPRF